MSRRVIAALFGALVMLVGGTESGLRADSTAYTVENLGSYNGLLPTITGMNDVGSLSGYVTMSDGTSRAVRYDSGQGWHLVPGLENTDSQALGINAAGDLAGYAMSPTGRQAFRYTDGTGVSLLGILPGGSTTTGEAINVNGDVVGYGDAGAAGTRGWISTVTSPALVPLPSLGGTFTNACGINDSGAIAGASTTGGGTEHALIIAADHVSTQDLGSFDGPTGMSFACAIDNQGEVGGTSTNQSVFDGFFYDGSSLVNIDTLAATFSETQGVNNGVAVGLFFDADGNEHAFVHTAANGSQNLDTLVTPGSGWAFFEALAVNGSGQIAGDGTLNGQPAVFRVTPVKGDTTPPTIQAISATPAVIALPNGAMVPVTIHVTATDDQDPSPVCGIVSVDTHAGPGSFTATAGLTLSVQAAGGADYTVSVSCHDATGNAAGASTDVIVLRDTTPPTISSVAATPSSIWPPDNKMVPVTVSVSATDNVDAAPACALTSVSGGDFAITGRFTASVRAKSGNTYVLTVTCGDQAGNKSSASTSVVVGKVDPVAAFKAAREKQEAALREEMERLSHERLPIVCLTLSRLFTGTWGF